MQILCYNIAMVFSSLTFLLLFLPAVLAAYFACRKIWWSNAVLLTGSLIFYAWGEPVYVLAMLFVTLTIYGGTLLFSAAKRPQAKKLLFALTVAVSLSALLYFKYAAFFVNQLLPIFGNSASITTPRLPIGISFFTFQAISYVVDAYRGEVRVQKNFALLLLYVVCFPQLIAGPIVQYSDIEYELNERQTTLDDFNSGMRRFAIGLGKKVLIANILGEMLASLPSADASFTAAWLTSILFALQIYFDFSAYSDMAIGLGQVLGFRYQENFNYPYIARSVSEFWRRWHISLGRFFKEYVYIPLGGNRKSAARTTLNLLFVWTLTGLWHGASWNFVLWGLYYGVFIALEHGVFRGAVKRIPRALGTVLTLLIVLFGWALFYQTDLALCARQMLAMLGLSKTAGTLAFAALIDETSLQALRTYTVLPLVAGLLCVPILPKLKQAFDHRLRARRTAQLFETVLLTAVVILSILNLVADSYNPFLYFRF
ncbi:MAG: MBOAT family O-acyltransferase [Clostridiaceae bacterium]